MLLVALVSAAVATANDDADVAVEQVAPTKKDCHCEPRPQDQIWLVSTRHLGCPSEKSPVDLEFDFYEHESGWRDSEIDEFFVDEEANQQNTVFFIHGYQSDWHEAIQDGLEVYYALTSDSPDPAAIRFVIWSWPSEKTSGILRDVREKGFRTHVDGYYVGWLLAEIDAHVVEPTVRLIGHSYGARIALGGLHVWGGGESAGVALSPEAASTEYGE